jgi:hypothetical protein
MQAGILQQCNTRAGRKKRNYFVPDTPRKMPAKPFGVGLLNRPAVTRILEISILSIKTFDPMSTKVC